MNIRVRIRQEPDLDPRPVPDWLDNPDHVAPCPCGGPLTGDVLLVEGHVPLSRWYHPGCLDFLRYDMTPEEIEQIEHGEED